MTRLNRVLIANRGEIAVRIARAATSRGMDSVGVYSPVDALSLHTRFTSESREIGEPNDPLGAYLDIDALIEVARSTGCDCVHPGYGFLAESAAFAARCEDENIAFVGPPSKTLALFGNKVRARDLAASLGIPIIKGSESPLDSADEAVALAEELGYPVMLKAASGGGGRGMRIIEKPEEMQTGFERCSSEAAAAFGDGSIFVEKYLHRPRHIEVQILADAAGHVVHLYERDCSVQLRHQKVIEVAPAPGLKPELREAILRDAVRLVKGTSYISAGTVEFLVVPETGEYFFIECNPRIQVEHTITEEVTGVDLVEAQFHLAEGASLASLGLVDQKAVPSPGGFALQARVVVQGSGSLSAYKEPSGAGVRVDGCGYLGYAPPPQFDPLLAKLICRSSRLSNEDPRGAFLSATDRVRQALKEFHIGGVRTNIPLLYEILSLPEFRDGDARTTLLEEKADVLGNSTLNSQALDLLHQQSLRHGAGGPAASAAPVAPASTLEIPEGDRTVLCPMDSAIVEVNMKPGDAVAAGDPLLVVSAMKMETLVTAPCAGTISVCAHLEVGDTVAAGQTIAGITPSESAGDTTAIPESDQTWGPTLEEINTLRRLAEERLAPGSADPGVVRQRDRGKLTCRERILLFLDKDSFREVGSVA
ncbi:MAG: ATP-grasp domain-containing protein, partial [Pseudomonadales bacterium]|nr:ATP-grasp domain-containing protein [Pseudomonadales bacterium]